MTAPPSAPASTSVGKCSPARTRSTATNDVRRTPVARVTHGRHEWGERWKARYVAVAVTAPQIAACPEKNESVESVSVIEGALSGPRYWALSAACSAYASGRGRRTATLVMSEMARVSESDSA